MLILICYLQYGFKAFTMHMTHFHHAVLYVAEVYPIETHFSCAEKTPINLRAKLLLRAVDAHQIIERKIKKV